MFRKYKQQPKSERFSNLPRSNTLNLPIISLGSAKRDENPRGKNEKNVGRYSSQRKFSFAEDNLKGRRNIPTTLVQSKQKQIPSIVSSHQTTQKIQEKSFITERQKIVYVSPPKRKKLQKLPEILAEGDFIKRKQDSIDTSHEDKKIRKQMFQFDFIKSQNLKIEQNKSCANKTKIIEQVIAKKLQIKEKDKVQSLNLLKQVENSLIRNQINQQRLKEGVQRLSNEHRGSQLVGPQAVQKFYLHYKKIDQIKQLEEMKKQSNPLTVILTILENYNIPPKRMDIIKIKGAQSILDLNHIGLGQSISIKAISEILDSLKYFDTINLSYNFISFDRIDLIVPKLKGLKRIDLSHNKIGKVGVDMMAGIILSKKKSQTSQSQIDEDKLLQSLNLQENGLPDTAMNLFLIKAKAFQNLKILNLNKNFLGNNFALHLKEFLIDEECLQELYLHWNDITSKGMKLIFQGLSLNRNLKVLDLSWNQIGYETIPSICNFFKKNRTLLHLDISNCNVCLSDAFVLAESIKYNNTILGIHFEGNQGFIDSFGYIHPQKKQDDDLIALMNQILTRIKGVQRRNFNNGKFNEESDVKTCWICEDWQQHTIKVIQIKQRDAGCFIHFEFDDFKGQPMEVVDGSYQIKRMLPYRKVRFFITKVNKKKQFTHQATDNLILSDAQFDIEKFQEPFVVRQFYIESKQFTAVSFKQLNVIYVPSNDRKQMFKYDYQYQLECRPRSKNVYVDQSLFVEEQPPLKNEKKKIKIKIKKQRNRDNDKKARQLLHVQNYFSKEEISAINKSKNQATLPKIKSFTSKCALFDLENSKIRKLITSDEQLQKVQQVLQQNYQVFSNIYRYLSNNAVNSVTSVYYISEMRLDNFLDFMQFQTKTMTRVKIKLKLFAALSVNDDFSKMQLRNGDIEQKLFNRPQFLQFLLRIAMEKYSTISKSKRQEDSIESNSTSQGFRELLKSLKSYEMTIQMPRQWRSEHLTTYDISLVIKSYQHLIESIYSNYSGIFQKHLSVRLQKKMLLNEFKQIFIDSGIRKSRESLKDAQWAFIQSKQMQVQEGQKEFGLSYNEFLEAFIRMAHVSNLKPIGTEEQKLWEKIELMNKQNEKTEYNLVDFTIPLFLKFQALLKCIYTGNRQMHKLRRMERIFEKGLFGQEAQMMMEIFKERLEQIPKIERQNNALQSKLIKADNLHPKVSQTHLIKLALHHLVQRLQIKYKKLSQQLDRNYNQYDEISQPQNNDNEQQTNC